MDCGYFAAGQCRSCPHLAVPYAEMLARKEAACRAALPAFDASLWQPPVPSAESSFRNKAKMVVSGTADAPRLGIVGAAGQGQDLSDCLLYPPSLRAAFAPIKDFIRALRLPPYDIARRRGELKFVLLTQDQTTEALMLRFVLRSTAWLPRLRAALPELQRVLPALAVISANIQPVHQAIVEGEEEIPLAGASALSVWLGEVPLYLRPRSFFQTNTAVATALYATARDWVAACAPASLWDLFCGVGGFALFCAPGVRGAITGIEISPEAIDSARQSAAALGLSQIEFTALPADAFAEGQTGWPECVIVNPPRRGLGAALAAAINTATATRWLLYSSCNPASLAADLARLSDFVPRRARLFDMFPHTDHAEVLVLLERRRSDEL
ncbi:23S rRNA (uracil(747)-C(5))-methyltransferase RlmC [Halothiobacillus sp. DCM-1]|uniref:23S rRNA (uracil(747)-C(5))-methyltransferase RlmC n=1 Tax=Halothiobacillus sp. DCM-1 TaxID=3112558 RepID=UPI003254791E